MGEKKERVKTGERESKTENMSMTERIDKGVSEKKS